MARGILTSAAIVLLFCGLANASPGPATNDEYALLVLANRERANAPMPPLVWADSLAAAAREHSDDMAAHGCLSHNSCDGRETWVQRLSRYYSGWTALAENIVGVATDPRDMHAIWMSDLAHRENILDDTLTEFGSGIAIAADGGYGTEDFGSRGPKPPEKLPTIPAATVLPRVGGGQRELLVNVFHYGGSTPQVHALLGSECVALDLVAGTQTHGTYEALHDPVTGCVPLVFEVIRSDGVRATFPSGEAILVGDASCPERSATLPTANCGAGTNPPPGGSPESISIGGLRMSIRPKAHQLVLQGVLPATPGFDPTGTIDITVVLANGTRWSQSLPTACRVGSCIYAASASAYRSRYDTRGLALSFTKSHTGSWSMRFSAKSQTFGPLAGGPVDVVMTIENATASASGVGRVWQNSLFLP